MSQAAAEITESPVCLAKRGELSSIDILRGLAALGVAFHHANTLAWRTPSHLWEGAAPHFFAAESLGSIVSHLLFGFGFLGVPLFFVISGFCIHLPYAASDRPLDPRDFAIRRFFRLYPPYLLVVFTCMALLAIKFGVGRAGVTLPNALGHLFFWHYFTPASDNAMGITPVLWTIALEVHFYLLYALTLPLLRRIGIGRSTLMALGIGIVYRIVWIKLNLASLDLPRVFAPTRFAPMRFGEWLLGAWIAEAYATGTLRVIPRLLVNALVAGAIVVGFICIVILGRFDRTALDVPATVGFAVLVAAFVRTEENSPGEIVGVARMARWLGARSYSLYLWHYTVIASVIEVYARLRKVPDKNAWGGSPELVLITFVGLVAAVFVADLLYRFVEAPSHRVARALAALIQRSMDRQDHRPLRSPSSALASRNKGSS